MRSNIKQIHKGIQAEELLRFYFLKAGYFVTRGVPYQYEGFDITDIDLFLYGRVSVLSRERSIVDIKNKKTPQALERIFWIKGLQAALNADKAIVATTDNRSAVVKYGQEQNVVVLDGHVLKKIEKLASEYNFRLTDEDFFNLINTYSLQKFDGDWKSKVTFSKSLLVLGMDFNHINQWLNIASFFATQVINNQNHRECALRCLYLICSFILIGIDFQMKEISFMESKEKILFLNNGFTYGSKGRQGIETTINTVLGLIRHTQQGAALANQIQNNLISELRQFPSNILSEYFSKANIAKSLFDLARDFETLAMNRIFQHHSSQENPLIKGTLFCLLDYWNISRSKFENLSTQFNN